MKIFSWVKSKLHGKDNTIKPDPESTSYQMTDEPGKEDFSGCPNTLLAIGTLGTNLGASDKSNTEECSTSTQNSPEIFEQFENSLSIEEILEILPEDEEITEEMITDALEHGNTTLHRATGTVQTRGKDSSASDNRRKKGMYKKSLTFLLKKAFVCGGGFVPSPIINPILKDPFPDPKMDNSRMEKILRAMLRKKKHGQTQKYLETPKADDEEQREGSNANNWNKADSECKQITYSCKKK